MLNPPVGILGGTFDPVHNGHLRLAIELRDLLQLESVRLIPSARPPHRGAPTASPGQRARWVRVALANEPALVLDDRELLREGPSYSVDTLASLSEDLPNTPLCLIMGSDVFASLPRWHEWQRLFDYAHLVLIDRPGVAADLCDQTRTEMQNRKIDAAGLRTSLHGGIHLCEPPPLEISSSRVRSLLAEGRSPRFLLPEVVYQDVMRSGIYSESNQKSL